MTLPITDPVFWLLPAVLAVAVPLLLRQRAKGAALAERIRVLESTVRSREEAIRERDAELHSLAGWILPDAITRLWRGRGWEGGPVPHGAGLHGTSFGEDERKIVNLVLGVADKAAALAEGVTQSTVRSVTRTMQALVNEQQTAILDMIARHDSAAVLHDAQLIDHASSQLGRRAQVISVLTGTWPGRLRRDTVLMDVVRGGVSRIRDYRRISINNDLPVKIVGRAVEPLALALAELLDNAARHSEPGTDVEVKFKNGHHGITIMIDDSGIGLNREDAQLAATLLTGREPIRLTRLSNPPRLGFAVVGVLSSRYGFHVSVEGGSPYGGVRATVFLPRDLLIGSDRQRGAREGEQPAAVPAQGAGHRRAPDPSIRAAPEPFGIPAADPAAEPAAPLPETAAESFPLPPADPFTAPTTAVPLPGSAQPPTGGFVESTTEPALPEPPVEPPLRPLAPTLPEPEPEPVIDEDEFIFPTRSDGLPQRHRPEASGEHAVPANPGMRRPTDPLTSLRAFTRANRPGAGGPAGGGAPAPSGPPAPRSPYRGGAPASPGAPAPGGGHAAPPGRRTPPASSAPPDDHRSPSDERTSGA